MNCDDVRDRLLDPDADAHLASCAACRADADRLRRTWSMLAALPLDEPDTDSLRRRFMTSLYGQRTVSPGRRLVQAAALLVAFGGGLVAARVWPSRAPVQEPPIAQLRQELGDVRALLTLSLMQQAAAAERLQGIRNATRLLDTRPEVVPALVEALRRDPDVNVRLAAIRALEQAGSNTTVRDGVLDALGEEESPLVSIALMDFVVAAKLPPAIAVLRRVAADTERDDAVRDAAATAINRITGERR